MWKKYYDLDSIRRLKNEGRELLGHLIEWTEKRDGENVSIWLDGDNVHVSSHNLIDASEDIITRLKKTPEYERACDLLRTEKTYYGSEYILYGELMKTISPTRIEPKKKYTHWILFDAYDLKEERYTGYNRVYQMGYQWKIPVVRLIFESVPSTMEELSSDVERALKWCRRHRREGVVLKAYDIQVFAKERVDLPKKVDKIPREVRPQYPPMPEERISRALIHAFDELKWDENKWKDKKIAMPVIARHIATEAREHNFQPPKNLYTIYLNTPIEKLKEKI
jgi:cation transport regulator ChaB